MFINTPLSPLSQTCGTLYRMPAIQGGLLSSPPTKLNSTSITSTTQSELTEIHRTVLQCFVFFTATYFKMVLCTALFQSTYFKGNFSEVVCITNVFGQLATVGRGEGGGQ